MDHGNRHFKNLILLRKIRRLPNLPPQKLIQKLINQVRKPTATITKASQYFPPRQRNADDFTEAQFKDLLHLNQQHHQSLSKPVLMSAYHQRFFMNHLSRLMNSYFKSSQTRLTKDANQNSHQSELFRLKPKLLRREK